MKKYIFLSVAMVLVTGFLSTPAIGQFSLNKDVHNNSGVPAWDFKIILDGIHTVSWHFDGYSDRYHFANFEWGTVAGTTVLRWYDPRDPSGNPDSIPSCDTVHIGYTIEKEARVLGTCWTDKAGQCITTGSVPQVTTYHGYSDPLAWTAFLRIDNVRLDTGTVTIRHVNIAILETALPLDQLNPRNSWLASQLHPIGDSVYTLHQNDSVTLEIHNFPPNRFLVYRFEGDARNDYIDFGEKQILPTGACCIHGVGCVDGLTPEECSAQGGEYMGGGTTCAKVSVECPTLTQWGLIILVALLVVSAVFVMLRRRKASVPV